MVVFDSNIFIYVAAGKLGLHVIDVEASFASITAIEVLGYHNITAAEARKLTQILQAYKLIELDEAIVKRAIELRQLKKISLGDAIVAATALEQNCPIWTVNDRDFAGIGNLAVFNPLKAQPR